MAFPLILFSKKSATVNKITKNAEIWNVTIVFCRKHVQCIFQSLKSWISSSENYKNVTERRDFYCSANCLVWWSRPLNIPHKFISCDAQIHLVNETSLEKCLQSMGNFITRRTFIILEGLEGLSTSRCSHMFYTTSFRYERRRKALVFGSIFRHTRNVDTIYLDRITIRLKIKNANKVGVKLPSNSLKKIVKMFTETTKLISFPVFRRIIFTKEIESKKFFVNLKWSY